MTDVTYRTSPSAAAPLLTATGLAFSRNGDTVFGPLDLCVDAGEALLVRGANGAGKTSLLRVLAGLLRADAGHVSATAPLALLGHAPGLKAELTARENLEAACGIGGWRRDRDVAMALGKVGLGGCDDALLRQLSAGQKKRLSLARLWLSPATLWLLDEPYANLDLEGIALVDTMLAEHLHAGGGALLSTHGAQAAPPVRTRLLELGAHATDSRATGLVQQADGLPGKTAARAHPHPGLASSARALLLRDARLLWRRRGDALQPLLFALLVVVLFALAGDADRVELAKISAAVIWVAALLAGLLALDNLFRGDAEDGTLEQWMLSPQPLAWLVALRIFSHWLASALPLVVVAPLLGEMLYLPHALLSPLLLSLLLGTPLLALLGAIVAALTVGMKRSGILLALLALPLYVPVLVFGAGSVAARAQGLDASGAWLLLGAGLVLALVLAPLAAAAALRIALD